MKTQFIFAVGASATGKTTTMKKVADRLCEMGYNVNYIESPARKLLNQLNLSLDEIRANSSFARLFQYAIMREFISDLRDNANADFVIADRSIYDILIYTQLICGDIDFMLEYHLDGVYIYFPPFGDDPIDDGVRDLSVWKEELKMYEKIKNKCDIILQSNDIDERVEEILVVIK
jgi:thymidylate kinase